jgi:hypothetical protein
LRGRERQVSVGLLVILSGAERPLWPNFAVKPPVSGKFPMKPIYAAWLGDPGPGDLVECVCGHSQALTASMLATAGMGKPYETIMELQRRLQCRECDERGTVVMSVRCEMDSAILC